MRIELTSSQRDTLLELVEEALGDIGPEIRHAKTYSYKQGLQECRRNLSVLRGLLGETESADQPGGIVSPGLVGSP